MNILVVDDEKEIADIIAVYLEAEGFKTYKCNTGKEAIEYLEKAQVDLAILDIMLPDISGLDILRKIRSKYTFPVLMLSAKSEYMDKINGLALGADDYIPKPFNSLELVARVKAQLRRVKQYNKLKDGEPHEYAGLELDMEKSLCTYEGKEINVTPTEFAILKLLCEKKGNVVSLENIQKSIYGGKKNTKTNAVMVHIRHIREKMSSATGRNDFIKTMWGVGYKINV